MIDDNFKEDDDRLLGKTYHFYKINDDFIKSPISGTIVRVFHDQKSILISNCCGFQLIVRVQSNDDFLQEKSMIISQFKEGDKIKRGKKIFLIIDKKNIKCVTIFIPWQPLIVKKVEGLKIFYRNPWLKLKTKLHGDYF